MTGKFHYRILLPFSIGQFLGYHIVTLLFSLQGIMFQSRVKKFPNPMNPSNKGKVKGMATIIFKFEANPSFLWGGHFVFSFRYWLVRPGPSFVPPYAKGQRHDLDGDGGPSGVSRRFVVSQRFMTGTRNALLGTYALQGRREGKPWHEA